VACRRRAGRSVGEKGDYDGVCLLNEEAAELVKPDLLRSVMWWAGELSSKIRGYGCRCIRVVWVRERVV
jgi:hypothetical protein